MNNTNPFEILDRRLDNIEILILSLKHPEPQSHTYGYLSTKQAAEFLSKTPNAIRVMVCKNQIKSIKKGNSLYFLEIDLIEYLESGRRKTPAELAQNCEDALVIKKGGSQK